MNVPVGSLRLINSPFVWDISNFPDKCKEIGEYIVSPSFTLGGIHSNKIKWHLRLYPFGNKISKKEDHCISLYLCSKFCSDINEIEVSYKFFLWNSNNEVNTKNYYLDKFSNVSNSWGIQNFYKRDDQEIKDHLSLSIDSTLSVACSVIVSLHRNDSSTLIEQLFKNFKFFFLSDNLSDVTIKIDNKELKAHKIILSASSEVFKAMFNHDMSESNDNVIMVTDISYDVMKEVLRFIYCGKVENLDLFSRDLIAAADKYDLPLLNTVCEQNLLKSLNVDNACEILSISHLHHCSELKNETIEFIIKNISAIKDADKFNEIKDSTLLVDILHNVAQKTIT